MVSGSALRSAADSFEEAVSPDGVSASDTAARQTSFKASAKCDFNLGAYKKAQRKIPSQIQEKIEWPLSPVQRGKMFEDSLPLIRTGRLYQEIENVAPHGLEDRREVHRTRKTMYSYFKDADGIDDRIVGLSSRKPPVQKGVPHRLLEPTTSSELKDIIETDLQKRFENHIQSSQDGARFGEIQQSDAKKIDARMNEEISQRLEILKQRVEEAKICREAWANWTTLEGVQEEETESEWRPKTTSYNDASSSACYLDNVQDEDEEQKRIALEFREYEIESLASVPPTPKDGVMDHYGLDAFEEDGVSSLLPEQIAAIRELEACYSEGNEWET